jgi:4-amino-4-deoxy-L-arabinose transferase-like glycosyltransferase
MKAVSIPSLIFFFKLAIHAPWLGRYGYHRDELYFIDCGQHLAFGYVDHAPLIPWLARVAGELFEHDRHALRAFSVVAGASAAALTAVMARAIGGGRIAQLLAGACIVVAPAYLRMAKILCIPAVELLVWTLASYLVLLALLRNEPKRWLLVGIVAGIGLLTKHTMLLWGAGIAVGMVLTPSARPQLLTRWPYIGLAVALVLFAPNLLWQHEHGWPTLEFIHNAREGMLARIPRALFAAGQLLYMHPFAIPVWGAGLVYLFRAEGGRPRVLAWMFVTAFAVLLLTRAKPYYLAPAYPVLFAAGAVAVEKWLQRFSSTTARTMSISWTVAAAAFAFPLSLPVLSVPQTERLLQPLVGWAVPVRALTHDLHDEFGWREQVATVARAYHALSAEQRAHVAILTGNYGEASAVAFFGPRHALPRAISGHMTHHLWTRADTLSEVDTVIAYGLPRSLLDELFQSHEQVAEADHPLADDSERHLPIYVCRSPRKPLDATWQRLRRYDNGRMPR